MINCVTIYSPNLEIVTNIYDFVSLIWTTQYFAAGEFELVVEYSDEYMNALERGNFIVKNNTREVAVIERVYYQYNADEGGTITVSGRMAISLLDRRLIYRWNTNTNNPYITTYCAQNQRVEEAARNQVTNQCITPVFGGNIRIIPNLVLGADNGYAARAKKRVSTYKNLYSALTSLLAVKNMSHRIVYDELTNKLVYEVFRGTNRSDTLVFSRQRQNLLSLTYEETDAEWKNLYYIGGDGEALTRFVTTEGNGDYSQLERREMFYSASSSREENETAASYAAVLQAEAVQETRDNTIATSMSAEIDLENSGYEYGETFSVGDIITLNDVVNSMPRITTVIESQSSDGYTVNVEFNEDKPEEEEE